MTPPLGGICSRRRRVRPGLRTLDVMPSLDPGKDPHAAQPAEVPLLGGRITPGVVRVGDTVRRPVGPHSAFVHAVLRHLEQVGFGDAPRFLGIDDQGRECLSYIEGFRPAP